MRFFGIFLFLNGLNFCLSRQSRAQPGWPESSPVRPIKAQFYSDGAHFEDDQKEVKVLYKQVPMAALGLL